MKVIVAGMPKTGTKSMQAALIDLGYNVYDYMENYTYLRDEWMNICTNGGSTEDFRRMFENVDAVTDMPGCYFWEEIHKAFPESKIVLTMRETETSWINSLHRQIKVNTETFKVLLTYLSPTINDFIKFSDAIAYVVLGTKIEFNLFKPSRYSPTAMLSRYRRHNNYVLHAAPKDKLLVYNVKEGWEPLCKFLNVDVPDKPFPHKNVRGNIMEEMLQKDPTFIRGQKEVLVSCCLIAFLLGFGVYKTVKMKSSSWLALNFTRLRKFFGLN